MTKSIVWLLAVLIALVSANLALTAYVAFKAPAQAVEAKGSVGSAVIPAKDAQLLADAFLERYNRRDADAVYASLERLAQVQIGKQKLTAQVEKLHNILGQVTESAYTHAEVAGSSDGNTYYNLFYKVSMTGQIPRGTMKLMVLKDGDRLGLVGFFLYGSESTADQ